MLLTIVPPAMLMVVPPSFLKVLSVPLPATAALSSVTMYPSLIVNVAPLPATAAPNSLAWMYPPFMVKELSYAGLLSPGVWFPRTYTPQSASDCIIPLVSTRPATESSWPATTTACAPVECKEPPV